MNSSLPSSPVKGQTFRQRIRMSFLTNDKEAVEFEIELYPEFAPKTVENFVALCDGFRFKEDGTDAPIHELVGTLVHRMIPGCLIEAGRTINDFGDGNPSMYGEGFIEDVERAYLWRRLDESGLVCMAHRGDAQMTSRFFIILKDRGMPMLSGRYVCFGKVVSGLKELIDFSQHSGVKLNSDNEPCEGDYIHVAETEVLVV